MLFVFGGWVACSGDNEGERGSPASNESLRRGCQPGWCSKSSCDIRHQWSATSYVFSFYWLLAAVITL